MNTAILRSRILDMAIHGQLVPQDPSEGTAMDLLKEIAHQRGKAITPITDNVPFSIPDNWCWVKLGDICTKIVDGDHNPPKGVGYKTEYKMLSSQNINYDRVVDIENCRYLSKETFDLVYSRTNVEKGDILLTCVGTLGRSCVYTSDDKIAFQRSVSVIRTLCIQEYIKRVFDCPYAQLVFIRESTGTAQKGFYLNKLQNLPIPLPPLPEQHRIVAKVEELLSEVDKIEQAQTDITHAATILRSRILDSALKGELTHSNTEEWESVSLINVCKVIMGQSPAGDSYNPTDGIEFHQGKTFFGEKYLKPSHIYTNSPTKLAEAHSIVISVRAPVGTSNIVDRQICIGRGLAAICPKSNADLMFIYYLLESRSCLSYLNDNATGTTFKAISGDILKKYSFPLPPLSEQRRIVAKLEELLSAIDNLK